jgi:hypothetical protein
MKGVLGSQKHVSTSLRGLLEKELKSISSNFLDAP